MDDYILVTLAPGRRPSVELKLPAFVPLGELLGMLGEALDLPLDGSAKLQAEPLGRVLDNKRTLEQEGVACGALLTVV
ncbi:EsaB/YukD family protein [Paenibacillus xanthanilyticus]|uniref:EsaB/YukD family protein n=1 Tax=Paenibacillus xanthanilyticus TaxID=1783531 RepID=A0ABV8K8D9_9BACL